MSRCSPNLRKMVQSLSRDPEALAAMQRDPEAYFDRFDIAEADRQKLRSPTFAGLTELDLHPLLRMHFMLFSNPPLAEFVTVKDFLPRLSVESDDHG